MINTYYHIYQAERGKTAAEIRAADAQLGTLAATLGGLAAKLGQLAAPLHAVRRSLRRQRPPACPVAPNAG
jgi:hypothetical protein